MDQHLLNRLLRLAKKTGSPVILSDKNGGEPTVLMPLETYEAMIDGFMLENDDFIGDFDDPDDFQEDDLPLGVPMQEVDQDLPFPGEEEDLPEDVTHEDVPFDPPMSDARAPYAETTTGDLAEERFYLEPIE